MFAFAEKLRVPITHPLTLIAQSLFGLAQIRPEYTSSRIQLNCLYTHAHKKCFGIGLLGWASAWSRISSLPLALPPSPSITIPQWCSGAWAVGEG